MLRWYDSWYRLVSGWYPDFWDAHFPKSGGDQTSVFEKIKEENGKIDGIVHSIAHANTEDLHNDFIYTSKNGYLHAMETSHCYLLQEQQKK